MTEENTSPKRFAYRLAGGATLKRVVVEDKEGCSWNMVSRQTVECPRCGKVTNCLWATQGDIVVCSHCSDEIKVLDIDTAEVSKLTIDKQVREYIAQFGLL